jgi:hypothetical protein
MLNMHFRRLVVAAGAAAAMAVAADLSHARSS